MLGRGGYLPYKCRVPTPSYSPRQILQGSVPTAVEIYLAALCLCPPGSQFCGEGRWDPPKQGTGPLILSYQYGLFVGVAAFLMLGPHGNRHFQVHGEPEAPKTNTPPWG